MHGQTDRTRLQLTTFLYVIDFPNGKRYFGITSRAPDLRWKDHLKVARRIGERPICKAIRKYPTAMMQCLAIGEHAYIADLEQKMIAAYKTTDWRFGYNFGAGGDFNPMLGKTHSPEIKAKIAAAGRGRIRSPESKAKTSAALKGRPIDPERRAKISAATKLAMSRPEVIERMRAGRRASIAKGFS